MKLEERWYGHKVPTKLGVREDVEIVFFGLFHLIPFFRCLMKIQIFLLKQNIWKMFDYLQGCLLLGDMKMKMMG